MVERRQSPRNRCLLGARAVFNGRSSTLSCTIKNHSEEGALLMFGAPPFMPEHIEPLLDNRRTLVPAQVVWRKDRQIGIIFPRGRFMTELQADAERNLAATIPRAQDTVLH